MNSFIKRIKDNTALLVFNHHENRETIGFVLKQIETTPMKRWLASQPSTAEVADELIWANVLLELQMDADGLEEVSNNCAIVQIIYIFINLQMNHCKSDIK